MLFNVQMSLKESDDERWQLGHLCITFCTADDAVVFIFYTRQLSFLVLANRWMGWEISSRLTVSGVYSESDMLAIQYWAQPVLSAILDNWLMFKNFNWRHWALIVAWILEGLGLVDEDEDEEQKLYKFTDPENIRVPATYTGPHIKFPLTVTQLQNLIACFKKKQVGWWKQVCLLEIADWPWIFWYGCCY